jgi:hypothetical protein
VDANSPDNFTFKFQLSIYTLVTLIPNHSRLNIISIIIELFYFIGQKIIYYKNHFTTGQNTKVLISILLPFFRGVGAVPFIMSLVLIMPSSVNCLSSKFRCTSAHWPLCNAIQVSFNCTLAD